MCSAATLAPFSRRDARRLNATNISDTIWRFVIEEEVMRNALLAVLAVTVSATLACAQDVKHEETSVSLGPQGNTTFNMTCPAGYVPSGIKNVGDIYVRWEKEPDAGSRVANLRALNPASSSSLIGRFVLA